MGFEQDYERALREPGWGGSASLSVRDAANALMVPAEDIGPEPWTR
jgi:hypothetical protein